MENSFDFCISVLEQRHAALSLRVLMFFVTLALNPLLEKENTIWIFLELEQQEEKEMTIESVIIEQR